MPLCNDAFMTRQEMTWGPWTLYTSNWTLVYRGRSYGPYEVDLETMQTAHEVLDWIVHFNAKTGIPPEDTGYLVTALSDIFEHLPSNFPHGKTIDVTALLKEKWGADLPYVRPHHPDLA